MQPLTPLQVELSTYTGVIVLSEIEDLFYDSHNLSLIQHYDFSLEHLKAVYDVGLDELLKSECLIGLELPKGYTIGHLLTQIKNDHNHDKESLKVHLKSLLDDMVILIKHTRHVNNEA